MLLLCTSLIAGFALCFCSWPVAPRARAALAPDSGPREKEKEKEKASSCKEVHFNSNRNPFLNKIVWPSGLRRWLKAPVRKGIGSNPTAVSFAQCIKLGPRDEAKSNNHSISGRMMEEIRWRDKAAEGSKHMRMEE